MKFTKEYIKECDRKEIQGLKNKFEVGDRIGVGNCPVFVVHFVFEMKDNDGNDRFDADDGIASSISSHKSLKDGFERNPEWYWLPTGDQLDDEIVKICKEREWIYNFRYSNKYYCSVGGRYYKGESIYIENCTNPLIAKIKLLKALLEDK